MQGWETMEPAAFSTSRWTVLTPGLRDCRCQLPEKVRAVLPRRW